MSWRNVLAPIFIALFLSAFGADLVGKDATGVKGEVVDKAEHAPIRNAYILVHRYGETDKSVRTDGSGRYAIELSPNIYDVFISADGFAPVCRKVQVLQSGMQVFDAVLDASDVGMQLSVASEKAAPRKVQGVVGDIPGGLPPDGTNVIGGILSSEPRSPRVATPTHVRVAQGVMRSFLVKKVNPSYPPEAQKQHVEGTVVVRINIDKNGHVTNVEPVSGHPLLMPAAIDAVKQWKYKPYLLNQTPVEVETTVLLKFVISGGNAYSAIASAAHKVRSW
jgi:periplasmic protein TonB